MISLERTAEFDGLPKFLQDDLSAFLGRKYNSIADARRELEAHLNGSGMGIPINCFADQTGGSVRLGISYFDGETQTQRRYECLDAKTGS